jgi:hypothetical protein
VSYATAESEVRLRAPDRAGFVNLTDDVKMQLTRSLGVSGSRLETMLNTVRDDTLKIE